MHPEEAVRTGDDVWADGEVMQQEIPAVGGRPPRALLEAQDVVSRHVEPEDRRCLHEGEGMVDGVAVDCPSDVGVGALGIPPGAPFELGGGATVKRRPLDGRALGTPARDIDRAAHRDAAFVRRPALLSREHHLDVANSLAERGAWRFR